MNIKKSAGILKSILNYTICEPHHPNKIFASKEILASRRMELLTASYRLKFNLYYFGISRTNSSIEPIIGRNCRVFSYVGIDGFEGKNINIASTITSGIGKKIAEGDEENCKVI